MRDLESQFAEFAGEVDGRGLATAADVRRGADRRARRRMAVLVSAAVVVLAAAGAGVFRGSSARPDPIVPPPVVPTPSPTPAPTAAPRSPTATPTGPAATSARPPSSEAPPPVTSIPTRAFFALPSDRRKDNFPPFALAEENEAPGFCGDPLAADPSMTARRGRQNVHRGPGDPQDYVPRGIVAQTIAAYRPGGAAAVVDRLRVELADCRSFEADSREFTLEILDPPTYGDEAVHVVRRSESEYGKNADQILVVRVGDIVTVLSDSVWEGGEADPADVRLFGRLAVETIEEWR